MKNILFICHGNICRSPMAEAVLRYLIRKMDKESEFFLDSAATDRDAIGSPIHRGTRNVLIRREIPFEEHYARLISESDFEKFDMIICMDDENIEHIARDFGWNKAGTVLKLLSFCKESRDVADPWYTHNFDETFDDIWKGCNALLSFLLENAEN